MKRSDKTHMRLRRILLCCLGFVLSGIASRSHAQTLPVAWGNGYRDYPGFINGFNTDELVAIDATGSSRLGLKSDGTVWRLGNSTQVSGLSDVIKIATNTDHSLALKSDGTVWAWGDNRYGQLGDGSTTDRDTPAPVSSLNQVVAIAAGDGYSLAVKSDGTAWAWGANTSGQLGDGTLTNRTTPVQVRYLTNIVAVSTGGFRNRENAISGSYSLALRSDGTVWEWGTGFYDEILTAQQVDGLTNVIAIDGGGDSRLESSPANIALKADGTVWSWSPFRIEVTQVPNLSDITRISAGATHRLALNSDGTVWAWGDNEKGQLGDGTLHTYRYPPIQVVSLHGATAIAAGTEFSLALGTLPLTWRLVWQNSADGNLYFWYFNATHLTNTEPGKYSAPPEWRIAATLDLNHDGDRDLLWHNTRTGTVAYWLMQGTMRWAYGTLYENVPTDWIPVATMDLDVDGNEDILWQNTQTSEVRYWLMGSGPRIRAKGTLTRDIPAPWRIVAALDLNEDGLTDLIWRNMATGEMSYWRMNGLFGTLFTSTFGNPSRVPLEWRISATADIDGDGDNDLIWQNTKTGDVTYWLLEKAIVQQYGTLYSGVGTLWQIRGSF